MKSIHKTKIANRFNRSVLTYDQHAKVQKQMAHQLIERIPYIDKPVKRICEVGCGTGFLTSMLIERYPQAEIVAIDLAPNMINMAKEKVKSPRVHWIVGDAEQLQQLTSGSFDLIISNATIQWLSSPENAFRSWTDTLKPTGWMIASTFGQDTFRELATTFQKVERELHMEPSQHHLKMHSLEHWQMIWAQGGLKVREGVEEWQRLRYATCRDFLQSIKATGANYSETKPTISINRHLLPLVMNRYDQFYQTGSDIYATYHLLYMVGQKDEMV